MRFYNGDFKGAKSTFLRLEKGGEKSFELYYNLSSTFLALLDLAKHREYHGLAAELDRERINSLSVQETDKQNVLLLEAPRELYFERLVAPIGGSSEVLKDTMLHREGALVKPLFFAGNVEAVSYTHLTLPTILLV